MPPRASLVRALVKLARPTQWSKSIFVAIGPVYGIAEIGTRIDGSVSITGLVLAVVAFALASSACYVINDIRDAEADRLHPRKRRRPIASGAIGVRTAIVYALCLLVAAAMVVCGVALIDHTTWVETDNDPLERAMWLGACVGLHVANVLLYSLVLKRHPIIDVMSLSLGFVLRVLGGCAAAGVSPSTWLLNTVFFVAMFLAFGKRLGERRTMGDDAAGVRGVQAMYTDDVLRMSVVVTAVAALITYANYVQDKADAFTRGFNLLWLTMLPASYGLFRAFLLLERGVYDDPTELAVKDRPFQIACVVFAVIMGALLWMMRAEPMHTG